MKKKLLSIAICFVMVAGLLAGVTMPIYAEEEYDGENVKLNDNDSFNLDDFELNTSNVTYMYSMFAYCTKIESVTGLETGNVTNMNSMFEHFEGMFQSCKKIKIIDLSNFRMDSDPMIYSMYDATRGEHFYTEDANEVRGLASAGWTYEGISHYVYDKNSGKGIPQYRVYNPNSSNGEHNWTTDVAEYEGLINAGWKDEGAHWNVQDNGSRGTGIVGNFRYIDAEMPELVCTYTFKSNGTGTYDVSGEVQNLTYKVNGDILSITFEGQEIPMEVEFTVNAEALTMKDVTGADIVYYRV